MFTDAESSGPMLRQVGAAVGDRLAGVGALGGGRGRRTAAPEEGTDDEAVPGQPDRPGRGRRAAAGRRGGYAWLRGQDRLDGLPSRAKVLPERTAHAVADQPWALWAVALVLLVLAFVTLPLAAALPGLGPPRRPLAARARRCSASA